MAALEEHYVSLREFDRVMRCRCHFWVVRMPSVFKVGRCGRCRRVPEDMGLAADGAHTVCLHDQSEWGCRGEP